MRAKALLAGFIMTMSMGSVSMAQDRSFGADVAFLREHRDTIVLTSADGKAKVAIVPSICGRVFTTTATGDAGPGYGSINDVLLKSGKVAKGINSFGGEDRFWMGPEGGQFAIFFKKGEPFTHEYWQTPAAIDIDPYTVVSQNSTSVQMVHNTSVMNASGTTFNLRIDRTVRLVEGSLAAADLKVDPGSASWVAFETDNAVTNTGTAAWKKETGLLSIWTLGMFKPSASTTVVAPYVPGSEADLGPIVKDDYFGKVPAERIAVGKNAVFFRGDSEMVTKIGIAPKRTKPICGAWDPERNVLTIVTFTFDPAATNYVNSMWEHQAEPYKGDVFNSYNHGPAKDGAAPENTFYELETSSPALALAPGQSGKHVSRTIHATGERKEIDRIARACLGASLDEIEGALAKPGNKPKATPAASPVVKPNASPDRNK